MKVLGYHISSNNTIVDSDGTVCDSPNFGFLLVSKPGTIRIMYDLDYSINLLGINFMPKLTVEELIKLRETTRLSLYTWSLRYVENKFFSIKRSGAFAYYCNASQYVNSSRLDLPALDLAQRAKDTGDRVVKIFEELGLDSSSLTSPERAYTRTQIKRLYQELQNTKDPFKKSIIRNIGLGVFPESWDPTVLKETKMVCSENGP